ncbi:DNA sulfur modification protein DndB [Paenibacillus daejeonensis]|uniref:DNA sulfur modification protein DndB n=1 Tax=Paenibacillus daejeonensis TaxID=135193 RepID=UPI00038010DA|nr:DNA sulfur modification protein DndB [Paenibacillus daejeonensis]
MKGVNGLESIASLSELISQNKQASLIEVPGTMARTFGQSTLSTTLPVSKLFSIYEIDLEVQRQLIPQNLSRLMDYVLLYLDHDQTIYFPGILLSARGAGHYDEATSALYLQPMEKCYVVDGQHRLAAFRRLAETLQSNMARAKDRREYDRMEEITAKLRKLYDFPISVMIYRDIDAKQERQLFSDINKLPRKIGGNLAVMRDQRRYYHILASRLVEEYEVMNRLPVDMLTERGKGPEYLFSYALLIELMIALFEGRLKAAARHNGYHYTEQELEQALGQAATYMEQLLAHLPEPDRGAVCWSENVQIALALFLHQEAFKTSQFNPYHLKYAIRILPHVQWERIYKDDEKDRLPRRSRIMKAHNFIQTFFQEQHLFLIKDKEENG